MELANRRSRTLLCRRILLEIVCNIFYLQLHPDRLGIISIEEFSGLKRGLRTSADRAEVLA